jgi:hypothetical protein
MISGLNLGLKTGYADRSLMVFFGLLALAEIIP